MGRMECHCHTHYSNIRMLDSINTPKRLIDKAIELDLAGLCCTDHESLSGHVDFDQLRDYAKSKKEDFKIGYGNEIYLVSSRDKNQKYYHYILIAKNFQGYKALRELSSNSWRLSYYDRGLERVPTLKSELENIIKKYGKGNLISSTACLGGELDQLILEMIKCEKIGNIEGKAEYYNKICDFVNWNKKLFGDDFYFEIQPAKSKEQLLVNNRMPALSKYFNVKIIVTTDAHYLNKEDRWVHAAYLKSRQADRETDEFYESCYLQPTEDIIDYLKDTPLDYHELETNTLEIYNKIEEFTLHRKQQVPQVKVKNYPKIVSSLGYPTLDYLYNSDNPQERYWVNQCINRLKKLDLFNDTYLSRLEEEADIQKVIGEKLNTCMFAYPIFLQHYIDMFWKLGSTVGAGRGSACSGLNHWLLGITQINPIKYNLPYWRYSNKERIELGDIDIDICPSKRQAIFAEIRKERGELGCVQVCTFGTETTRSAIQTACRGYSSNEYPNGIDIDTAQYMTSLAPSERGFLWPIHDLVYGNKEKDRQPVKTFVLEVNKYPGLLDIMEQIEGLINHRGTHASGVCFYENDPYESASFMKSPNGDLTTQLSLHSQEYCGDVKFDYLVTEIQDVIVQCIQLLQKYNKIDPKLSLREAYDKYLHPEVLPIEDSKLWEALQSGNILKCFQFDSMVGSQTVRMLKPTSPLEMANCNSIMRLMAVEKGGETPSERYRRMKNDMTQWYQELSRYGISEEETAVLEKYYLSTYGSPPQQENLMTILMDPDICNFSLAESNDARKIVAKKQMDRIEELHEKILTSAKTKQLGRYVWDTAVLPQCGYSFSLIHSLAYSFVGLQTVYLATYFNPVFWNTACLRVDAGLDEESSSNYNKLAKAVGNIIHRGISLSLVDINKSEYMFEPDLENNSILFSMKALANVNGDTIDEIINNRPYNSLTDFQKKVKVNKRVMISLIKSGAFDRFAPRERVMEEYIWTQCSPKKRITLQNFNGLMERNLIPESLDWEKRLFVFNKALRKNCKITNYYIVQDNYYDFYEQFFDVDLLEPCGSTVGIPQKTWQKLYTKGMDKARDYFKEHQPELLHKLNQNLFQEMWDKYAAGSLADWEMDSLGFYYHEHPLKHINKSAYNIVEYSSLPDNPTIDRVFKRGNNTFTTYKTNRIIGTVIAKDDTKSCISLLTVNSGVVTVKMSRDYYARLNRQISEPQIDGTKKVIEKSWFTRGNMLMVNGFKRSGMFFSKSYKNQKSHQVYKIININDDNTIETEWRRYGES